MGYSFVDVDHYIEEKTGLKIKDIFREKGEAWFRNAETETIKELAGLEKVIIATGGGLPCHGDNMKILKEDGLIVYLKLTSKELFNNLKSSKKNRPLMTNKSDEEMKKTIKKMLKKREPYYNQADLIIEGIRNITESTVNKIQRM